MRGCHGRLVVGVFGVLLLACGCGRGDNVRDSRALQRILEEAMAADRLQFRGVEGEELAYAPNQDRPYTGWVADLDSGLLSEVRSALQGGMVGNLFAPDLVDEVSALARYRRGQVVAAYAWHSNRQLELETNYRNGEPHGTHREWYTNGVVKVEEEFRNGASHGVSRERFANTRLSRERRYRDGTLHGRSLGWFANGQLSSEVEYEDGVLDGLRNFWYEDGSPRIESNWQNGRLSGVYRNWHSSGGKLAEEHYEDGRLSAAQHLADGVKRWHPNGAVAFEGRLFASEESEVNPVMEGWSSLSFKDPAGNDMGTIRIDAEGLKHGESVFRPLAVPSVTSLFLRRGEIAEYFVKGADILRGGGEFNSCPNVRIFSTGEDNPRAGGSFIRHFDVSPVPWEDDNGGDGYNFSHAGCLRTNESLVLISVSGSGRNRDSFELHVVPTTGGAEE